MPDETLLRAGARLFLEKANHDTSTFCKVYRPQVVLPGKGSVIFVPYPRQREVFASLDAGESGLIFKSRQTGMTTTIMLQRLRSCLVPNTSHLIVSAKAGLAGELIDIARHAARTCDPPFPLRITTDNQLEFGFSNGSRIVGEASTPESGRTYAVTTATLDEVRALAWPQETWQSLAPTVTHGGALCMVSTPDIEGSFFYRHWLEVSSGLTPWAYHVVHWQDWPGRTDEWAETTREKLRLTRHEWQQEFELEWGSIASAIFSAESIALATRLGAEPWLPSERPTHAIGGDIAMGGAGRDASVLVTLDTTSEPFRVAAAEDLGELSAVALQARIEERARERNAKPWLDCTGIGWGVVSNLSCPAVGVNFTGGTAVTKADLGWNVPREKLLSHLALGLEKGKVAIPPGQAEIIASLRSAQREKRKGLFVDWLDALALAYWAATGGDRRPINLADLMGSPSKDAYRASPPQGFDVVGS